MLKTPYLNGNTKLMKRGLRSSKRKGFKGPVAHKLNGFKNFENITLNKMKNKYKPPSKKDLINKLNSMLSGLRIKNRPIKINNISNKLLEKNHDIKNAIAKIEQMNKFPACTIDEKVFEPKEAIKKILLQQYYKASCNVGEKEYPIEKGNVFLKKELPIIEIPKEFERLQLILPSDLFMLYLAYGNLNQKFEGEVAIENEIGNYLEENSFEKFKQAVSNEISNLKTNEKLIQNIKKWIELLEAEVLKDIDNYNLTFGQKNFLKKIFNERLGTYKLRMNELDISNRLAPQTIKINILGKKFTNNLFVILMMLKMVNDGNLLIIWDNDIIKPYFAMFSIAGLWNKEFIKITMLGSVKFDYGKVVYYNIFN